MLKTVTLKHKLCFGKEQNLNLAKGCIYMNYLLKGRVEDTTEPLVPKVYWKLPDPQ